MDGSLPNFKVGEAASNIFQKNDVILDNADPSIVVLAKNVIGSLSDSMYNDKQVPQSNSSDQLSISPNQSDIIRVNQKLYQVLDENKQLKQTSKQTAEESETVMKQMSENIKVWQKEVSNICEIHNQEYIKAKQFIDRIKAYHQGLVQNESTKSVSMTEGVAAESNSLNTSAYLNASIEKESSLAQNNSLTKTIKTFSSRTRDSSLDNNMTKLKIDNMSQLQDEEMQCVRTESGSVTASVDTQKPATEPQCASTATEIRSTDIHSNLSHSKNLNLADIENKLQKNLEGNKVVVEQSEKLSIRHKDVMSPCNDQSKKSTETEKRKNELIANDFSSGIASENDASHTEKRSLTQERESPKKLKIVSTNNVSLHENGKICDTTLAEEEKENLYVTAIQKQIENMTAEDKNNLIKNKAAVQNQSQRITMPDSYAAEKSILEKEILMPQEKCTELTKKLDESNALYTLKEDLSRERKSLEELRKLLDDEMKSHKEEHKALTKENTLLKNKCDMLTVDVNNFNTELIESHKMITNLRKQITELREAADTADVYRVQNNA